MGASTAAAMMEPDDRSSFILKMLRAAMALPGARVDRTSFLRSQLRPHYTDEQVREAIEFNPAHTEMSIHQIEEIADSIIKSHVIRAAGISFAAGLPGGIAMAATIPADNVQFVWHAIVVAQKLAYLYGWPDLLEEGEPDEETLLRMVLLIGVMLGAAEANRLLAEIAKTICSRGWPASSEICPHPNCVLSANQGHPQMGWCQPYEAILRQRRVKGNSHSEWSCFSRCDCIHTTSDGQTSEESPQNIGVRGGYCPDRRCGDTNFDSKHQSRLMMG